MNALKWCLIFSIAALTGCSAMMSQYGNQKTQSSSLVEYLYPDQQDTAAHQATIPTLNLPATVGIAFIPNKYNDGLHHGDEVALLNKVKKQFMQYDLKTAPKTRRRKS